MGGIVLFIALSIADAYLSQAFVDAWGIATESNRVLLWLYNTGLSIPLSKVIILTPFAMVWGLLRRISPREARFVLGLANSVMGIIVILELEVYLIWHGVL